MKCNKWMMIKKINTFAIFPNGVFSNYTLKLPATIIYKYGFLFFYISDDTYEETYEDIQSEIQSEGYNSSKSE